MKPTDWLFLGLTFATGLFIGMAIYVVSFKPTYAPENLNTEEDSALEFSIIGKAYGGDLGPEYIRPSFRLLRNGTYDYIQGGDGEDALDSVTGKLSKNVLNRVVASMEEAVLLEASWPTEKDDYRIFVDGIDYQYQITLDGTVYQLDTCNTDLDYDSELAISLEMVWNELGGTEDIVNPDTGTATFKPSGESIQEQATSWLKSRLDPTPED